MKKYFGTDGIRFIYDISHHDLLIKIAKAITKFHSKEIIIGMDTRESSPIIAQILCSNINKKISFLGVISTPGISFLTKKHKTLGIMITASHNPYQYNGLKFFHNGNKFTNKQQSTLEKEIDSLNDCTSLPIVALPKINTKYFQEYLTFLKTFIRPSNLSYAFDCGNGAISSYIKEIVTLINPNCHILNSSPNGKNINLNCGATSPLFLFNYIKENNIPFGFCFDGDADRIIFMDQTKIYDGDDILYLFAHYFKIKKKTIILTPYSNPSLKNLLKEEGFQTMQVNVGDENIARVLKSQNLTLGGEPSGHIIHYQILPTGDGLLNALNLITIINKNNHTLLKNKYTPSPSKLFSLKTNNKNILNNSVIKDTLSYYQNKYSSLFINVRSSGTENVVRLYLSHPDINILNSVFTSIISIFKIIDNDVLYDDLSNKIIDEKSEIGEGCSLSGECHITNSIIGKNCIIKSSYIDSSKIGNSCLIGPFTNIHHSSIIQNNCRIGNYVEIKNSSLGNNNKVAHLTYIGDTKCQNNNNFGCGSITVNYDGKRKHQTIIGNNVFIGCNSQLIAPITIEDNAFIAAGSTITSSLNKDDFAIARSRLIIKPGGSKKYQ